MRVGRRDWNVRFDARIMRKVPSLSLLTSYNRLLSCYCLILTAKIEMELPTARTRVLPLLLYRTTARQRRTSPHFFLFCARSLSINNRIFFNKQWLLTFLVRVPVTLILEKIIFKCVKKFISNLTSGMCCAVFINMRMDCYRCDIVWHNDLTNQDK